MNFFYIKRRLLPLLALPLMALASCESSEPTDEGQRARLRPSDYSVEAVDSDILKTYVYPVTDPDDDTVQAKDVAAFESSEYEVWVKVDDGEYSKVQVLMSDPSKATTDCLGRAQNDYGLLTIWESDGAQGTETTGNYNALKNRTFSFVSVSFDDTSGSSLTFKVKSKSGNSSTPTISPASYHISAGACGDDPGCFEFKVYSANKYMSVDFWSGNTTSISGYSWLTDMLCIFVDPLESEDRPQLGDDGVVEFKEGITDGELAAASTIYIPKGYYNLQEYSTGTYLDAAGAFRLDEGQSVYIEGGAFVDGLIYSSSIKTLSVTGRGILSGRRYIWDKHSEIIYNGVEIKNNMVHGGSNCTFEGIMMMEGHMHGIVASSYAKFDNVKMMGWHCNNDGFRPGLYSEVKNCFLRACDDFFYNYNIKVEKCVLWPMFNGSILTNGWSSIDIGGSELTDIDIINPEWTSMGNNRGLAMSQNKPGFNTPDASYGYGRTILSDIRIEGNIPGFVNLKANSTYYTTYGDTQFHKDGTDNLSGDNSAIGYGYGEFDFINIKINNIQGIGGSTEVSGVKSNQISGIKQIDTQTNYWSPVKHSYSTGKYSSADFCIETGKDITWMAKDMTFTGVTIGGELLTLDNVDDYFFIDPVSAEDIYFEGELYVHPANK